MANDNTNAPYRIYKRGETYWAYISIVVNGQRIKFRKSTGQTSPVCANKWCLDTINKLQSSPVASRNITLDAACEKWYNERGQFLTDARNLIGQITRLLSYFGTTKLLSDITRADISAFISYSQQHKRSPATINRYLCLLSSICTRAKDYWEYNVPPFRILSFKQKEPKENIKYFKDWVELQKVIDCLPPYVKPIVYTAVYTGLRRGRIMSLKWEQIDWDNDQIIYMGKDGRPKSVPMVEPLKKILSELPRDNEYVFTRNGHRLKDIRNSWYNAFKKSGVKYLNFHALRHTTATWLLQSSHDLRTVQSVLGHMNISTTTKYAHLVNTATTDAMKALFNK